MAPKEPQVNPGLLFFLGSLTALAGLALAYVLVHVLKHFGLFKEPRE